MAGSNRSAAAVADSAQRHLDRLLAHGFWHPTRAIDPHDIPRQARDTTAVRAREVRVNALVGFRWLTKLEAPDMIAHLGSGHDSGVSEIVEVTIQRDAIEALTVEGIDQVGVAQRSRVLLQHLQDGQARLRDTQTGLADRRRVCVLCANFGSRCHNPELYEIGCRCARGAPGDCWG